MITFPGLGYYGRLGNQLFQIASSIGIAIERGDEWSFPAWDYTPYFEIPEAWFTNQPGEDAATIPQHLDERCRRFLQDYSLFKDHWDLIWSIFQPSDMAESYLRNNWPLFFELDRPVAVHVRRGDNAARAEGWRTYPLPTLDYYKNALDIFSEGPVVVFSDEPEWCLEHFVHEFPDRSMHVITGGKTRPETPVGGANPEPPMDWTDMQLMSKCSAHIIANSTYSWWGAWLKAGPLKAIYPSVWYGPDLAHVDWRLIIPDEWTEVPV